MSLDFKSRWEPVRAGRVRILWLVLGALLLVSALPIGLYHRQVLQLSQDKLVDTERVQQTDLTRSLAQEIQQFESSVTQQILSERQIRRSGGRTQGHAPAGRFRRKQSHHVHLPDGRGQVRKRHKRVAGKFPGGAGSICCEGVAASLRNLLAIAAIAGS